MPHDDRQEDRELVKGCKKQDSRCQKRLFDKYYGSMLTICLRYCNNHEDARDILQEGFAKVFLNIRQYDFKKPFFFWLRAIVVNTAIDRYRAEASKPYAGELHEVHIQGNLDDEIMDRINTHELLELIQALPEGARQVFNLYVIEGYSHKEIAEKCRMSVGTCRSQLNYARKLLQNKLSQLRKKEDNER